MGQPTGRFCRAADMVEDSECLLECRSTHTKNGLMLPEQHWARSIIMAWAMIQPSRQSLLQCCCSASHSPQATTGGRHIAAKLESASHCAREVIASCHLHHRHPLQCCCCCDPVRSVKLRVKLARMPEAAPAAPAACGAGALPASPGGLLAPPAGCLAVPEAAAEPGGGPGACP